MEKPYELVQSLNEELYERTKRESAWYSYRLDNYVDSISFNLFGENHSIKINLWNSEDSQQEYREATNDYEPLRDTLQRELKIALEELKDIV